MRALVLVDMDNVHEWLVAGLGELNLSKGPRGAARDAIVVLGMNCATARQLAEQGLKNWADFERLGAGILALLEGGARLASVEVALTLDAPEAVDRALVELLHSAPDAAGQGRVGRVWVLSRDKGLKDEVVQKLGGTRRVYPRLRLAAGCRLESFNSKIGKSVLQFSDCGAYERRALADRQAETQPAAPPLSPSRFIEDEAVAAWACEQEAQHQGSIDRVAYRVDALPSLLTQVAVTRPGETVVATGVARLRSVLQGQARLLSPCRADDGLEIDGIREFKKKKLFVKRVEASPLGPGAVRLHGKIDRRRAGLSARTRLPIHLVEAGVAGLQPLRLWNTAYLDDRGILAAADPSGAAIAGERVAGHLVKDNNGARFKVEIGDGGGWWCSLSGHGRPGFKASSWRVVPMKLKGWIQGLDIAIDCISWVLRRGNGREAVMASPIAAGTMVRARTELDGQSGRIGAARAAAGGCGCALLAAGRPIRRGEELPASPIQLADAYSLAEKLGIGRGLAAELRAWPLVVPADWAASESGGRK
jgi:hypothetical protein